jgi:hypothetical protein
LFSISSITIGKQYLGSDTVAKMSHNSIAGINKVGMINIRGIIFDERPVTAQIASTQMDDQDGPS